MVVVSRNSFDCSVVCLWRRASAQFFVAVRKREIRRDRVTHRHQPHTLSPRSLLRSLHRPLRAHLILHGPLITKAVRLPIRTGSAFRDQLLCNWFLCALLLNDFMALQVLPRPYTFPLQRWRDFAYSTPCACAAPPAAASTKTFTIP